MINIISPQIDLQLCNYQKRPIFLTHKLVKWQILNNKMTRCKTAYPLKKNTRCSRYIMSFFPFSRTFKILRNIMFSFNQNQDYTPRTVQYLSITQRYSQDLIHFIHLFQRLTQMKPGFDTRVI